MGGAYVHADWWAIGLFWGLPVMGLLLYLRLWQRLKQLQLAEDLALPVFIIFASYGIVLELLVTFLGQIPWSGMHDLGMFAAGGLLSWMLPFFGYATRQPSKSTIWHQMTFRLLMLYPLALAILAFGLLCLAAVSFAD